VMQDNLVELSDEGCLVALPDCLRAYGAVMKIRREIRDLQSDVCVLIYLLIRARIARL
jgi:hypothetical protein